MECGLFDGGEDGEHYGANYVEISKVFVMQNAFLCEMVPFDGV